MGENTLEKILSELQSMNKRIDNMELQMKQGFKKVDGIAEQVATSSEKLDVITEEQRQIKQATIDSREDITSLINGQERQDKILESLSLRSLEQETDIRDLKRIK